jgi:hypothetical protein
MAAANKEQWDSDYPKVISNLTVFRFLLFDQGLLMPLSYWYPRI